MRRRGFFRRLALGAAALLVPAPVIAKAVKVQVSKNPYLVGHTAAQFYKTGIVYAPYIPIFKPVNYEKNRS
tara:strand:- start:3011 stop:3223 length:213 start_codon:yes stop_codon:yes gene_type:complete